MALNVGVIGVGMIGQDHIRRLTTVLAGTSVVAVTDVDAARAQAVVDRLPGGGSGGSGGGGVAVHATGQDLVDDSNVDAVLVTSWGPTHEEYVLACIEAGKPVFCEKPLATTQDACARIIDAEVAGGKRLVQVGYMRRYDTAYRALKQTVSSGVIGAPLLVHSRHRNPSVPGFYTREMAITDTAVHDFDVIRWLLEEEYAAAQVLTPRRSRHGGDLQDPLLILLETGSGVLIDIETSVNIRYGYDIRGEVVGEDGTVELGDASPVVVRRDGGFTGRVPDSWQERFVRAYDTELQEWADAVSVGQGSHLTGPSAWDGYAAAVVSDTALKALHTGDRVPVEMRDRPDFYDKTV